jgi:multicomponent Na+:H+ antiporter subunit B
MTSLILRTATRFLMTLLLLFSFFLLLRGHNEPGGGFVGGLVAGTAFVLYAVSFQVDSARKLLRADPHTLIGLGLLLAAGSGVLGLAAGRPFLTGMWAAWELPENGELAVGTVLLFDVGVYLVVVGAVLTILFSLLEE